MSLLEMLEEKKVKVTAAATASAPLDLYAMLLRFFSFPRDIDASWINSVIILSSFSYEHYYDSKDLARSIFKDKYYDIAKKAYLREKTDPKDIPTDLHKLVRVEYFDPHFFANSAYGKLMAQNQAYRWPYKTLVRNYYGEADEAISVGVGQMAMTYSQAMGAGNPKVTAHSTGKTSHRGTYAVAAPEWKKWFDSFLKK